MNNPRIIYTPHPNTSPEVEAAALEAAYRYILRCYEQKKAAKDSKAFQDVEGGGDPNHGLDDASR